MSEPTYYTPELSEFHHGFKFEYFATGGHLIGPVNGKWEDMVFDATWHERVVDDYECGHSKCYRVKRLDQPDIEAEGWENIPYNHMHNGTRSLYKKNIPDERNPNRDKRISLLHIPLTDFVLIFEGDITTAYPANLFRGTILNRSELRFQMKRLGITK